MFSTTSLVAALVFALLANAGLTLQSSSEVTPQDRRLIGRNEHDTSPRPLSPLALSPDAWKIKEDLEWSLVLGKWLDLLPESAEIKSIKFTSDAVVQQEPLKAMKELELEWTVLTGEGQTGQAYKTTTWTRTKASLFQLGSYRPFGVDFRHESRVTSHSQAAGPGTYQPPAQLGSLAPPPLDIIKTLRTGPLNISSVFDFYQKSIVGMIKVAMLHTYVDYNTIYGGHTLYRVTNAQAGAFISSFHPTNIVLLQRPDAQDLSLGWAFVPSKDLRLKLCKFKHYEMEIMLHRVPGEADSLYLSGDTFQGDGFKPWKSYQAQVNSPEADVDGILNRMQGLPVDAAHGQGTR